MNIKQFVKSQGLKVTDAIVMKKRVLGMVDHYVLYMGVENGEPVFLANYKGGIQEVPNEEVEHYLQIMKPERIEPFEGSEYERAEAIERAWSREGEMAYSLFNNNCESFKNWVHWGKNHSGQVDDAASGAMVLGTTAAAIGLAKGNKTMAWLGLGSFVVGLLTTIGNSNQ